MIKTKRPPPPLQCGVCTACCFTHEITEIGKPMFTRCPNLGPVEALGGREGCMIYADRPEECRKFACSWLQGKVARDLRPDRLGLVTSGHVDEGIGPAAHVVEVWPGAVNQPEALRWFCSQTRAAEAGRIQPIVLIREVGTLIYGTTQLRARLEAEALEDTGTVDGDFSAGGLRERNACGDAAGPYRAADCAGAHNG